MNRLLEEYFVRVKIIGPLVISQFVLITLINLVFSHRTTGKNHQLILPDVLLFSSLIGGFGFEGRVEFPSNKTPVLGNFD